MGTAVKQREGASLVKHSRCRRAACTDWFETFDLWDHFMKLTFQALTSVCSMRGHVGYISQCPIQSCVYYSQA